MTQYIGLYKFRHVLSVVLALAVLLLALPAWSMTADAAETAEPEHSHDGWEPWTSTDSLPNVEGSYFLTESVRLSGKWTVPSGEINLCLNGNDITFSSGYISVADGKTLNIYDCTDNGTITGPSDGISMTGGNVTVNGGTIMAMGSGAQGIDASGSGTLTINGGTIVGKLHGINTNSSSRFTLTINGGTIFSKNSSYATIYVYGSDTVFIGGGTFYNDNSHTGCLYLGSSSQATITGGTFRGTYYGIRNYGTMRITDATVDGVDEGLLNSGIVTIEGGSFSGEYGIKNEGSSMSLSGSPTITGSIADIYLSGSKKINITGTLGNTMPYSVSTATTPPVVITNSSTTSYNDKTKFTSVRSGYIVRKDSNEQLMIAMPAKPCTVTFDYQDNVTASTTVTYESGDTYDTLPTPPARTGYIFKGWYTNDGEQVTEDTEVTADCTLKAKWEECKHDNITSWTDDGNGKHTADCSCGVTVSKSHGYSKWTNEGNGKHSRSCTDCGAVEKENHSYGEGVETKPATETEKGEKTYTCTVCGATKTEEIPMIIPGHTHAFDDEWTFDADDHWHECPDDGAKNAQAAHDWDGGKVTKEATETEKGVKTYTCTVCGATKTEEIPATGGNSSDNNDPTGGNDDPTGDNDEGSITVDSTSGENAPNVSISEETSAKLIEEIIAEHLTDEEKAAIENGDSLDIILVVEDAGDTVPAEDKQVTEAVLTDTEYNIGMYLNIDLIKLINGVEVDRITELSTPIRVTIEIPEALRSANRAFAIVRVHDGAAEILEDVDNDPDTITILTDRFSTYSIAYRDTDANPNTGIATPIAITGLACAVIVAAVAVKRKKIIE